MELFTTVQKIMLCAVVFCCASLGVCFAQETPPPPSNNSTNVDEKIEERIENVAQTADENTDFTELAENLKYFSEHPINLNNTNKEDLLQLGLLTDFQIDNLFKHIEKNGKLVTLQELQTIDGYDLETIYKLLPYVKVNTAIDANSSSLTKIFANGTHQILLRATRYLEEQKGYTPAEEGASENSRYLGNPWKYYARYRFTYARKISFGITAEKDAGEEFFKGTQSSFDYYSAHLFVRDAGPFKSIALGDYQLEYGQGLTLWTGLAFGKSSDVINIKKNAQGIRPYTSVNEIFFKRGAAVSVGRKKWALDLFYSHRGLDANLTDTLDEEQFFSSAQESGYHRTPGELLDKNSITEDFAGGHLNYKSGGLTLGATFVTAKYDKTFSPSPEVYNQFNFRGNKLSNTGIDYSYLFRNINFFGEVSRADNGSVAYLNGALFSLDPRVTLSVLNRYYPRDFRAPISNPLREGSNPSNERGTFFGLITKPVRTITLAGYFDAFTFPWLRFGVNAPSSGYEYITQLTFTPNKKTELYFRFKQTTKEQGVSGNLTPIDYLVNATQRNYRFNVVTKISPTVTLHSRVEFVNYQEAGLDPSKGFLIFQDVNYKPMGSPLSLAFRYALFDTDDYSSRVYAYENDVLYYYSIPAYYYKGSRYYLTLRYTVKKGIDVWLRYAQTVYDNQKTISSGLDEIDGNKRSEIKMQLRFEF